jgi:acyl dehydratase
MAGSIRRVDRGRPAGASAASNGDGDRQSADLHADHNPQPLHLDAEYAGGTEFGRIVVNGTFTFSLLVGLSVGDTTLGTLVANLGYDKVRMPAPVFVGDTLRASTEVIGLKESRSRPEAGIVTFKHLMHNQRGELVCETERTALLRRRS